MPDVPRAVPWADSYDDVVGLIADSVTTATGVRGRLPSWLPWLPANAGNAGTGVGHNDIAPYNACFDGDEVAGVFDWDLAGPTTPLMELAFIAWNCVPLWRDIGDEASAERIQRICSAYGGIHPAQLVHAVPAGSR